MAKKGLTYSFKPGTSPQVKKAFNAAVKAIEKQIGKQALTKVAPGQGNINVRQTPKRKLQREKRNPGTVATSYASQIPTHKQAHTTKTTVTINPTLKKQAKKSLAKADPPIKPGSIKRSASKPKNVTKRVAGHELQHALGVTHNQMYKGNQKKGTHGRKLSKPAKRTAKKVVYGKKGKKK